MDIVFDPAKDAINHAKHGVSLILAEMLFAGSYATRQMTGSTTGRSEGLPTARSRPDCLCACLWTVAPSDG